MGFSTLAKTLGNGANLLLVVLRSLEKVMARLSQVEGDELARQTAV